MLVSFRSALLVVAAMAVASAAPAQVKPTDEPLLPMGSAAVATPADMEQLPANKVADELLQQEEADDVSVGDDLDQDKSPIQGDLASMVDQLRSTDPGDRQMECLAGAIYFESRSEPLKGQLAVGNVIVNRTNSGRFPSSYCGVVFQRSQFSFVRGGAMPYINRGSRQWQTAVAIAKIVDQDLQPAPFNKKALFFHARRVSPGWHMTRLGSVGNHIFYR